MDSTNSEPNNQLLPPMPVFQGASFTIPQDPLTLRSVTIEIRNRNEHISLLHPRYYLNSGVVFRKPLPVLSGTAERCTFSKAHGSLYGTEGLLSFELHINSKSKKRPVIIAGIHGQTSVELEKECNNENESYKLDIVFSVPMLFPYWHAVGVLHSATNEFDESPVNVIKQCSNSARWRNYKGAASLVTMIYDSSVFGIPISVTSCISNDNNAELVLDIK